MAEDQTPKTDFPSELVAPVKNFQDSLNKVNEIFEPFHSQPLQDLVAKNELDALSKAKLDTVSAFAVNNLVWMWLRTKGENPKDAGVLAEINRVKKSMMRLKEITEKSKRVPVDSQAAKRLVKGSLWQPKDKSAEKKRFVSAFPASSDSSGSVKRFKN